MSSISEKYLPDQYVIVPRWGATKDSDWYPWLATQVGRQCVVAELDKAKAPTIKGCVASITRAVGDHHSRTVFCAHGVGCQALLHYLKSTRYSCWGVLVVAGWWNVDRPLKAIRPWIEKAPRVPIETLPRRFEALLSDNDPISSDYATNALRWEELGAKTTILPGQAHFETTRNDDVLRAIERVT